MLEVPLIHPLKGKSQPVFLSTALNHVSGARPLNESIPQTFIYDGVEVDRGLDKWPEQDKINYQVFIEQIVHERFMGVESQVLYYVSVVFVEQWKLVQ